MNLSVDTNGYTAFCKNDSIAVDAMQKADRISGREHDIR